jgi:hypothetical protein
MRKAREQTLREKHAANDSVKQQSQQNLSKKHKWRVGQRVTVTKKGSQTGKKGVVENPEWNGRVKVRMADSGKVKSYASHEIRKETILEQIAVLCELLAIACFPKDLPKKALDQKKMYQTSEETREIAQRITSDMEHQMKAELVGKEIVCNFVNVRSRILCALLVFEGMFVIMQGHTMSCVLC